MGREPTATESITTKALVELFPDALHSLYGYFNERDDALAQCVTFKTVIGLDSARRTFQNAGLVNARVSDHTLAG
jgi:hypothetical protein